MGAEQKDSLLLGRTEGFFTIGVEQKDSLLLEPNRRILYYWLLVAPNRRILYLGRFPRMIDALLLS